MDFTPEEIRRFTKRASRDFATLQGSTPRSAPQAAQQDSGSGLLSLIPFFDVGKKLVQGKTPSLGEVLFETATILPVGRLLKAGKVATKGAKALSKTDDIADAGRLQRNLLKTGTIAPSSTLKTAPEQNRLLNIVLGDKTLKGSAVRKFQNVDKAIANRTGEVSSLLGRTGAKIDSGDFMRGVDELTAGFDKAQKNQFRRLFNRISKNANLTNKNSLGGKEFLALKRGVNKESSNLFKKIDRGGTLSTTDEAVLELRRVVDDAIESIAPDDVLDRVKFLNAEARDLIDAIPELKKLSERGVNVLGNVLPGSTLPFRAVQASADFAARSPLALGRPTLASALAQTGGLQFLGDAVRAGAQVPQQDILSEGAQGDVLGEADTLDEESAPTSLAEALSNPAIQQQLVLADLLDPDSQGSNIEALQLLFSLSPQPQEQKPLTGDALKRALTSQSGLESLKVLEETLERDPGAFQRQALPNPFGITGRLTDTADVRAATDNVVDVIARLRSGAAITEDEARRFATRLPLPGDSVPVARRKLASVRAELESFINPDTSPSEDLTLTEALAGAL